MNTVNAVNAMTDVADAEPLLSAREVSVSFPVGSRMGARMRREEHLLREIRKYVHGDRPTKALMRIDL